MELQDTAWDCVTASDDGDSLVYTWWNAASWHSSRRHTLFLWHSVTLKTAARYCNATHVVCDAGSTHLAVVHSIWPHQRRLRRHVTWALASPSQRDVIHTGPMTTAQPELWTATHDVVCHGFICVLKLIYVQQSTLPKLCQLLSSSFIALVVIALLWFNFFSCTSRHQRHLTFSVLVPVLVVYCN